MRRTVTLTMLSFTLLLASPTQPLAAQDALASDAPTEREVAAPGAKMPEEGAGEPEPASAASLEGLTVRGRRPLTAASQRTVRDRDLLLGPRQSASDLMRVVPQLHISQHSGGGKGHQIFLRGFDAEHGEDVGVFLEGIPLNQPSHAHGIGYTDLHFLIPETVERVEVLKGPYEPRYGDFSTAGAVDFRLRRRVEESSARFEAGSFGTYQGTLLTSLPIDDVDTLLAVQGWATDGFADNSEWTALRAHGSVALPLEGGGEVRALYTGYGADWNASDAIPSGAVAAGDLGFYDAVDDTDGGAASRHHLSVHVDVPGEEGATFAARAYLVRSTTRIYSNYTYYLDDRDHGDQTEQSDGRWQYGFSGETLFSHRPWGIPVETTIGIGARGDTVEMGVWRTTRRERWDTAADYGYTLLDAFGFVRVEAIPTDWLRVILGARLDYLLFDVDGAQDVRRPSGAWDEDQPLTGTEGSFVPQPKASLVFSPLDDLDVFLNFGTGFHSPDARDPVGDPDHDIPVAYCGEVGARTRLWDRLDVGAAAWAAYLQQETFFDPLLGRSVDQGESRRLGVDLELRLRILPWLWTGLDVGFTDARLLASDDEVPGSPAWMGTMTIAARHPSGIRAAARLRYVGERALEGGQRGEDVWLLDLLAEYRWRFVAVGVSVENTLARRWKDAQFVYASRWDPGDRTDPSPSKHFTAGTPIAARGWIELFF